jgi:pimeloyl-ACP methyl ester carboxylesterase
MTGAQLRKSWYVLFFQLPGFPEWRVPLDNFSFIDRLYAAWSPNWDARQWHTGAVKKALGMPGVLSAALGYYRAMVRGSTREQRALLNRPTTVPTLVVCGEVDGSVGIDQFDDVARAYTGGARCLRLPQVGHFPHREAPDAVALAVLDFLAEAT